MFLLEIGRIPSFLRQDGVLKPTKQYGTKAIQNANIEAVWQPPKMVGRRKIVT